jgi:hypothetical protein
VQNAAAITAEEKCRRMKTLGAMLLVSALAVTSLTAQEQANSTATSGNGTSARSEEAPVMRAVFAERVAPDIDGDLSDAVWQTAPSITGFTQSRPDDGEPATERTEVRMLYDTDALYVFARMFDTEPGGIVARLGRRDDHMQSDMFYVMIDSYHDHRTCFRFGVNPSGVRNDVLTANDDDHGDSGWDPVWDAAARVDSLGWVAEFRIPFSQLRFSSADEQVWGINFSRSIFRKDESVRWSWAPNTEQGYASLFGHLEGLSGIPSPRRIEVLPYTVAKTDFTEGANPANPFNDGSAQDVSAGVDLKYGVTSGLTLDATINPDFGQVEADPAVVNLSAFETYFSERRPFFVEGANLFRFGAGSGGFVFGAPQLFYSRRIGKRPSRSADAEDGFVDNPVATRILGAAKLSGKTAGWSVGVLDAVTAHTSARIQGADGTKGYEPVEPLTNYGVLSLRKDMREGASGIGIMATSVMRNLNDPLFDNLRSSAYAGGVDFFHKFGGNRFAVNGTVSGSYVRGGTDAITRAQRTSSRYFQRPDQDYVSLDSAATSMTGYAVSAQAGKVSGNWTYGTDFYAYSPGLELNDAGFRTSVDRIFSGIRLSRRWLTPGKVFREFEANVTWAQSWNFGGVRQWSSSWAGVWGQFKNYWSASLGSSFDVAGLSDKATRGGPLMKNTSGWFLNASIGSDRRKPLSFDAHTSRGQGEEGSLNGCAGISFNIRPTSAVSLMFTPHYAYSTSPAFYTTRMDDPTATATFGTRYVFSRLKQKDINTTVRLNVSFSPNLSVQLYAQPFIASGDYEEFKEFLEPSSYNFAQYGVDGASTLSFDADDNSYTADVDGDGPAEAVTFSNPDFTFRSLRSNLVVRWEYTPGSTLFLVWNRGQSGSADDPRFRVFREFGNMFGDDQQNTFLLKVNYWLSR